MVTFVAGEPDQCFALDIVDDDVNEDDERFFVIATPLGSQISIPDQSSDVFILNDVGEY